ncbi:hypothetical protein ALI144C_20040 [Actinosynnema sp. ALI-1.44]|uniref:outer membrane protein assembly factor BamB family protein n=1 Tax=Actinosynnema sp. ALI-1.44 TaxID=1933779 RepID=UPI00097BB2E1|nr:PQQ-binding-like beta-propeller repeat protein [Actinosynnema sp. ALI-1.44]ONI81594.1 hypothetical protein ALI144C_20040 [Actinosynnema sp. ALI-1.44]
MTSTFARRILPIIAIGVVGALVALNWSFNVFGLRAETGERQWHIKLKSREQQAEPNCTVYNMSPGPQSIAITASCIEFTTFVELVAEIAADGKITRTRTVSAKDAQVGDIGSIKMISGFPVVLYVHPKDTNDKVPSVVSLDQAWNIQGVIREERTTGMTSDEALTFASAGFNVMPAGAYPQPSRALVKDTMMYAFTKPNTGKPNKAVAVDLKTGKPRWESQNDGNLYLQILAVQDDKVFVLESGLNENKDHNQSIVTLDTTTGKVVDKVTTKIENPKGESVVAISYAFVYADQRAYAVNTANDDRTWLAYSVG